MKLSTKLAPIVLHDTEGQAVELSSLWQQRPVVLAFIRHFG
ncbi:MAG: hypothetical protein ACI91F_003036 [Candidatus Binatia bacterium]|jgi:hypothetical protein